LTYEVKTSTTSTKLICSSDEDFSSDYRFGFNGQEKDNEIAGIGNSNTAQFWQYDTRLGRRWNLDPKPQIRISDYAAFGNNPIIHTDLHGDEFKEEKGSKGLEKLEHVKKQASANKTLFKQRLAKLDPIKDKEKYKTYTKAIRNITKWENGIEQMSKSKMVFFLDNGGQDANWDAKEGHFRIGMASVYMGEWGGLGAAPHELWHGFQFLNGDIGGSVGAGKDPLYDSYDEYEADMVAVPIKNISETKLMYYFGTEWKQEKINNPSHLNLTNNTTKISLHTCASVLLMNNTVGSRFKFHTKQLVSKDYIASVKDAIDYYNMKQKEEGESGRIDYNKR